MNLYSISKKYFSAIIIVLCSFTIVYGQNEPTENDYYKIAKIAIPEGIVLEVGGLVTLPNGDLAAATRRGEVYFIQNPYSDTPVFKLFATGLHEILGLAYKNDQLYCAQRGELTKLIDTDGNGKADRYQTIASWPVSGHYHEYSFGPKVGPDGAFYVTGNVGFGDSDWWAGKSFVPGRGWTMKITDDGKIEKFAAGMRSPCGIGMIDGEFFYGDNQGDWQGSGFISHVEKGDFMGHPASLAWADAEDSPVKVRKEMIFAKVNPRDDPKVKPEYVKNESMTTIYEMAKNNPGMGIKSPAVWLPHGILGVSTSEIVVDETKGGFGPFAGQAFVGDEGMSKIARVFLEKVKGRYQGASFDFRNGFRSGVLRMSFGNDNAMYVGGTNRGWGSTGKEAFGLERLVFAGTMPFEMKTVKAMPDGFEIEFTKPVDIKTAENVNNYDISSYTYKYHPVYGSPMVNIANNAVRGAKVAADGKTVRVVVDGLREGYIHEIKPDGVRSAGDKLSLLHGSAYYTLNSIPDGEKAKISLVTPKAKPKTAKEDIGNKVNTPDNQKKEAAPSTEGEKLKNAKTAVISDAEATKILTKNTCLACHKKSERAVGPSYKEVAARKYSNAKIVELIYNPQPQNWPDLTPMAPMTNMPKAEAVKIAAWINSLK
jgi:cytochrome c551/c552